MTFWLLRIALTAFALWFLRGLWVATQRPRLAYRSHETLAKKRMFITVDRQELLPPWRLLRETWLVSLHTTSDFPTREGDGRVERREHYGRLLMTPLGKRLEALQETIEAREEQLREMSK